MSKLGGRAVHGFTAAAPRAALKARTARANANAADLAPILKELQAASLRAIAAALNERGIRTPRGVGDWKAGTVSQLLARL
jgi:hypothetical protein